MSQLAIAQSWIEEQQTKNRPILVFCIHWEDRIPDEYFREIYHTLEEDFALCTCSTLEPEKFSMPGSIFHVPINELQYLKGVSIFICTDQYEKDFPEDSFVAAFPHSFLGYDAPLAFAGWQRKMYVHDAYFTTTPQTLKDTEVIHETLSGSCNPAKLRRKRPFYYFFPVGCPRIATIQAKLKKFSCEQDTILYAPTGYWSNPNDPRNRMIGEFAPNMIDSLLQQFPQYRICFRPCVTSWGHPDVQRLISLFDGHPRFAVSRDFDHLPEFARSLTLITEYSNIGEVFALSTLRPEVRCVLEAKQRHLTIINTGMHMSVYDNVAKCVKKTLEMPKSFWERVIRSCYGRYIYDPAQTMTFIRQALLAVVRGEEPTQAVHVQRVENDKKAWRKLDFLNRIFRPNSLERYSAREFLQAYPEDPSALAVFFLTMRVYFPHYQVCKEISKQQISQVKQITGHTISQSMTFDHISEGLVAPLLRKALYTAQQENDEPLAIVLFSLLTNYKKLLETKTESCFFE